MNYSTTSRWYISYSQTANVCLKIENERGMRAPARLVTTEWSETIQTGLQYLLRSMFRTPAPNLLRGTLVFWKT